MPRWTDEEIRELVTLWRTHTAVQIAPRLQRRLGSVTNKVERLREKGLLKAKNPPRNKFNQGRSTTKPIKPDLQDFDAVKTNYCRKRHISLAKLCTRFERDDKLAAELYRLAQLAKLTRLRSGGEG